MGKPGIGRKSQMDFLKECFQIYIWCMLQHMSSLSHNINIAERFTINNFKLKVKKNIKKLTSQ